jgi:hypothetical protein
VVIVSNAATEALIGRELVSSTELFLGLFQQPLRIDVGLETFIEFETLSSEINFRLVNELWNGAEVSIAVGQVVDIKKRLTVDYSHSGASGACIAGGSGQSI